MSLDNYTLILEPAPEAQQPAVAAALADILAIDAEMARQIVEAAPITILDQMGKGQADNVVQVFAPLTEAGAALRVNEGVDDGLPQVSWPQAPQVAGSPLTEYAEGIPEPAATPEPGPEEPAAPEFVERDEELEITCPCCQGTLKLSLHVAAGSVDVSAEHIGGGQPPAPATPEPVAEPEAVPAPPVPAEESLPVGPVEEEDNLPVETEDKPIELAEEAPLELVEDEPLELAEEEPAVEFEEEAVVFEDISQEEETGPETGAPQEEAPLELEDAGEEGAEPHLEIEEIPPAPEAEEEAVTFDDISLEDEADADEEGISDDAAVPLEIVEKDSPASAAVQDVAPLGEEPPQDISFDDMEIVADDEEEEVVDLGDMDEEVELVEEPVAEEEEVVDLADMGDEIELVEEEPDADADEEVVDIADIDEIEVVDEDDGEILEIDDIDAIEIVEEEPGKDKE